MGADMRGQPELEHACESCRVFEDVIEVIRGYAARSTHDEATDG